MTIDLGRNPWILICLMFLEILLIIIPAFISSKIENTSVLQELKKMGLTIRSNSLTIKLERIFIGICLGILFFVMSSYLLYFFKDIVIKNILGKEFLKQAERNAINTQPIEPLLIQLVIIIILQVLIIALCEEAFFRGFLIQKLELKLKPSYSILLSSCCFSIYHIPPFLVPLYTIVVFFGYYFTFGVLLSLIFKFFKNSLLPCILSHGLFNVLILLF
ncbi:MAG: lysostaphin resistance A-like protein [Candidatus Hermodarchaeota archaeon]